MLIRLGLQVASLARFLIVSLLFGIIRMASTSSCSLTIILHLEASIAVKLFA
jgi:hypothetical protein